MPLLRVDSFAISLDGYGAGPDQSREQPLFQGIDTLALGYEVAETRSSEMATHVIVRRKGAAEG